jgi:ABC-type nitrate/sulfonate/bicarbonate transport system substrate-binding protein
MATVINKRIVIIISILILLSLIAVWLIFRPRPFSVGLQVASINYPMMHAIDGGFFERQGLKPTLQKFGSANDALDALLSGNIFVDAAIPIQNIAAIENERPGTLGIAAVILIDKEHPISYLVVPGSSSIKSATELNGKKIVVFPGSHSETATKLSLQKLGVTNVTFIKRPPPDMPQALQTGEADAGIFYEPVASQAELQGWGKILEKGFWETHLLPEIALAAYTYNAAEAKKNPDIARRVIAAIHEAVLDARQNPQKAKMLMRKTDYLNASEDVINRLPNARVELAEEVDPAVIKQTLELYAANGIIPKTADLSPLLKQQ